MIVRRRIDLNAPLTKDQIDMLEKLKSREVVPDDDCPELTEYQLSQFRRVSKNDEKRTVVV